MDAEARVDPLVAARALLAQYEAASRRERNYKRAMYADLFSYALADLVASCEPLRAERAAELEAILRRVEYGGPAAKALPAAKRQRHLRVVQ